MGTIGRETIDILADIYFDIDSVCNDRKTVSQKPKKTDILRYRAACQDASTLVSQAVAQRLSGDQSSEIQQQVQRLAELTTRLGWKLLAICAHSEAFQQALRDADVMVWDAVIGQIEVNCFSIELFARTRNLEWRGPLLKHARHLLPELQAELAPHTKLDNEHPHHWVRTQNGGVRRPVYEKHYQVHIDACTFDPKNWEDEGYEAGSIYDPTIRCWEDGACEQCGNKKICSCLPSDAGQLVELVDYPDRGIGIRALANFEEGAILGEFVGEIRPPDYDGDSKYGLAMCAKQENPVALISPKRYGNWTRFLNHSCDASTYFREMIIGNRMVAVVEALRDIYIFEEITVNYGEEYWTDRECRCGSWNCMSKREESGSSSSDIPAEGS